MAGRRGNGDGYWWNRGPVTKAEQDEAFAYLRKHHKPLDRGSSAFRSFVSRLRKRREINRYLRGKTASAAQPSAPWQIIYGEIETGGVLTFVHTSGPKSPTNPAASNDPHKYLHMVITVAAHEIQSVASVYFDNYEVQWDTVLTGRPTGQVNATGIFAGLVRMQINYGTDGQSALSVPVNDTNDYNPVSAKWTTDHRQRGHAHVYFRLTYDEKIFKNGMPDITFRIRGKYLTDPRTGTLVGADSKAAMVLYDYMTNTRFGLGIDPATFNSTRLNQAVSDCEDNISLAGGGLENRYLINTVFTTDEAPGSVIDEMVASMAGRLVYSEGKWSVYAGKARTPVITIDEDDILSGVQLLTKTPRIDNFNGVRGTFISTANYYEEADFPPVLNTAYVAEDNNETIYEDLTFGMVTSGTIAQRLAKIELEQARQGRHVEFTASLAAYQAEPGEWVYLNFSKFGWTGETFEVLRSSLQIDEDQNGVPMLTVKLTLKVMEATVYDWSLSDEQSHDVYPDTNLPDPYAVEAPSGVTLASGTEHLYVRSDGTVFSRLYVSWTAAPDTFVRNGGYYEVQYYTEAFEWVDYGDVPGSSSSCYILDVYDGVQYMARVRSVNALGARSDWVQSALHTVVGKTAPPSDVPAFSAIVEGFGLKFNWTQVSDLDVKQYEIRYGTTAQSWSAATVLAKVQANQFFADKFVAGSYRFFIKAVDTTGNYSTNAAYSDLTVSAPSAPQNVSVSQIDNNVLVRWQAPTTTVFPVSYYKVFKQEGTTLTEIGRTQGTFATYVELLSGAYTYQVIAVDTAGNEGTAGTAGASIYSPPDFVLRTTSAVDLSTATLTNAAYEASNFSIEASANTEETWEDHFVNNGNATFQDFIDDGYTYYLEPLTGGTGTTTFTTTEGSVWMPVDTTETWESHFTSRGFTSFQDFIDAGYTYYLQPNGLLTGSIVAIVDLGEVLPQTIVSFDYVAFGSGIQPVPTVAWRETSGDPWTSGEEGSRRVTPSNFRYLRLTLTYDPVTALDWCVVTDVNANVQVKEVTDSGTNAVNSGDSGGTTISFSRSFLDVSAIVVTPQGTTELKPVVDFTDAPNPTSFKVLLFNAAGSRASGTVRWTARGVQAVL